MPISEKVKCIMCSCVSYVLDGSLGRVCSQFRRFYMPLCEVARVFALPSVSVHDCGDRFVENLGPISVEVDNFRITFDTDYPRFGWVRNNVCDMNVFCLLGVACLHFGNGSTVMLDVGFKATIPKGSWYRWSMHGRPVVFRVQSTPHWYPEQHEHAEHLPSP